MVGKYSKEPMGAPRGFFQGFFQRWWKDILDLYEEFTDLWVKIDGGTAVKQLSW